MLYRAVDAAGNVETDKAVTVKIDGTNPTVLVSGVADGFVYGDATDLTITWQARDDTSGIASAAAELDGEAVEESTTVPLHRLDLGEHTLTVGATDEAGNTAEHTVTFTSTTSVADARALVYRFAADDRLNLVQKVLLLVDLARAERALDRDRPQQAARALDSFVDRAERVSDERARDTLVRDGRALLGHVDGSATLPVVS
ncbi:FIMAH domain-containing protein [Saccharomonospora azurea]